jgi:hypothetical protein
MSTDTINTDDKELNYIERISAFNLDQDFFDENDVDVDDQYCVYSTKIDKIISTRQQDAPLLIREVDKCVEINKYAILSILKLAEESINIYTTELKDSIYNDQLVIENMANWLNNNSSRRITILLKKEPNKFDTIFPAIRQLLLRKTQLEIRISISKNVQNCNINMLCADDNIYKLKEINVDNNTETIVINFHSNEVNRLTSALKIISSDDYSYIYDTDKKNEEVSDLKDDNVQEEAITDIAEIVHAQIDIAA